MPSSCFLLLLTISPFKLFDDLKEEDEDEDDSVNEDDDEDVDDKEEDDDALKVGEGEFANIVFNRFESLRLNNPTLILPCLCTKLLTNDVNAKTLPCSGEYAVSLYHIGWIVCVCMRDII